MSSYPFLTTLIARRFIQGRLNFLFKLFMYAVFKVQFWLALCQPSDKTDFHSISSLAKKLFLNSGARLLSQTVSSSVPSAARGLTVVFGMGTGVPPGRIGTGKS